MTKKNPETTDDTEVVLLAAETMQGDLITALVDELKAAPDVWAKLNQHRQDEIIYRFEKRVGNAIREAVRMIASDNRPSIEATLEQITAKDGIKAVLTLSKNHSQRHDLLDAVGQAVLIVVADAEPYSGGEKPKADPDQKPLPIDQEAASDAGDAAGDAGGGEPDPDAAAALDAGIEAAAEGEVTEQSDDDQPADTEAAPAYVRDDGTVLEAILLIDEEWTGFGDDDAANLARIARWSDEDCQAVEEFCKAVAENPDDIPLRPDVIGGPLPGQLRDQDPDLLAEQALTDPDAANP